MGKGRIYNFFSGTNNRSGKGVTKQQVERDKKMGLGFFFRLFKNRLGDISSTSIVFSLCNFPILLFLFGLSGNLDSSVPAPMSPLYATLYGMELAGERDPMLSMLYGLFGIGTTVQIVSTASRVLMYCAFLLILTFGLSTLGAVYNMRSIVRCEPLSPWSEFFSAIRRNLRQGLPIAILDALMILFLGYDLIAYYANANSFFMQMAFYVVLFSALVYFVMRSYIYLILVTFDLKFTKLLKNSLFLVFLGWKRNLMCLLGSALTIFINLYLYVMFPVFGTFLPIVFTFGILQYIGVYAAYPVIETYMIEPYYRDHPEERPQEEEIEPVFTDRG